jgi:hypothetical protein
MILTKELIERCRTDRNGFTGATVRALGLEWISLKQGWVRRLRGTEITEEAYAAAYAGRLLRKRKKNSMPPPEDAPMSAEEQAAHERFLAEMRERKGTAK